MVKLRISACVKVLNKHVETLPDKSEEKDALHTVLELLEDLQGGVFVKGKTVRLGDLGSITV